MEMINLNILQLLLPVVRERPDPQLRWCSDARSHRSWAGATSLERGKCSRILMQPAAAADAAASSRFV